MKTVMILGGTKGVGKNILKSCINKGYNVSFCGRKFEEGNEIIQSLKAEKKLYFHEIDLNTIDKIEEFFIETIKRFKHMDYGMKNRAAYALTKSTLYTLSTHLAHHYSEYGIRSNYVVMGWTNTEGELELRHSEGMTEEELKAKAARILPMGRMLNPNDPIPAVMHLISDDSCMTTGSIIRITGGQYI